MERTERATRAGFLIAVAVTAVVTGAVGYTVGTNTGRVTVPRNVLAQSGDDVVSSEAEGWWYGIPIDVRWQDAAGTWHDHGRPSCLPKQTQAPVTFGSVETALPGPGGRASGKRTPYAALPSSRER